jgi:hypothetical protein
MNGMKRVKLTPEHKQQWTDTMSLMAWTAPGFRHLFYKLLSNNDGDYTALMAEFGNPYNGGKVLPVPMARISSLTRKNSSSIRLKSVYSLWRMR